MIPDTTSAFDQTPDQDVTRHDRHSYDRHGNRIVSARDGRVLRVCGEAATTKHLVMWEYHADERRYVCAICWPEPNA